MTLAVGCITKARSLCAEEHSCRWTLDGLGRGEFVEAHSSSKNIEAFLPSGLETPGERWIASSTDCEALSVDTIYNNRNHTVLTSSSLQIGYSHGEFSTLCNSCLTSLSVSLLVNTDRRKKLGEKVKCKTDQANHPLHLP